MTTDVDHELEPHGIAAISLYPGLVRTELVLEAARQGWLDLSNSESPEFSGRAIAALHVNPNLMTYSGRIVVAAEAACAIRRLRRRRTRAHAAHHRNSSN
jgi:NAD(P)-dependent dehydrogenase (short-subunit alcohol dehydrogenase family)